MRGSLRPREAMAAQMRGAWWHRCSSGGVRRGKAKDVGEGGSGESEGRGWLSGGRGRCGAVVAEGGGAR